jgi:hypothetical protein
LKVWVPKVNVSTTESVVEMDKYLGTCYALTVSGV